MTATARMRPLTAALAVIVLTGMICAWPLVFGGGWRTYQDNPCHLAGLHDLAAGSGGWSDAAFLGYPLTATLGPLWYAVLGGLASLGLPAGLLLVLFELAGFLAPAIAVLTVTRRHAPLWAATAAAWLVLVQRPWLAGFESPLGGMAPFGIAAACLVLIVGELARSDSGPRRLAALGALYGLLGLTHLFLVLPAVLAFAIAALLDLGSAAGRRRTAGRLGAALLGAAASAPYWLPVLLNSQHLVIRDVALAPHLGLLYLLAPVDPLALASGEIVWQSELWLTDAAPMVALVLLGLLALRRFRADPVARLGLLLAASLLLLVLVLVPLTGEPLVGPHSWRRLFLVRLALALGAAPALATLPLLTRLNERHKLAAALAAALVLSAIWWGRPLRLETPSPRSPEITHLEDVWRWLGAQDPTDRGRIYVQDTFYLDGDARDLYHSHLPALTARETGLTQVGAFFGGMPFRTEEWTAGQFGLLFGQSLRDTDDLIRMGQLIPRAAVDRLLLANPQLARKLIATGLYRDAYRRGRFQVLEVVEASPRWAETSGGATVTVEERRPGHWRLATTIPPGGRNLRLSLAWAPGWKLAGGPPAGIGASADGRLTLERVPAGDHHLDLRYRPDRRPWLLALVGWLGLAAVGIGRIR